MASKQNNMAKSVFEVTMLPEETTEAAPEVMVLPTPTAPEVAVEKAPAAPYKNL